MARNDERRRGLADAGLAVLAREGARGLTHRAVDDASGSPRGTASNYFRSREDLLRALVDRIGERLAPDPAVAAAIAEREPDKAAFAAYIRDIVHRLTQAHEVTLALFELRLEAARRPEIAELIGGWQRAGFAGDVAFNAAAGLPGDAFDIALFHYAIDGVMLDRLTTPIDPETATEAIVDALVQRLLR